MEHDVPDIEPPGERDIAIVGMAGRFPGARDLDAFWDLLREGREAITPLSDAELAVAGAGADLLRNPNYVKAGAVLEDIDRFDAVFFGYTPREAELLDPQQRIFLECAWAALEHAGCLPERFEGAIGVYAGVAWNTYLLSNLASNPQLFDPANVFNVFINSDKDFMPTRLSYKLNLKGPSMNVQTSCSTSLVAIHLACLSLLDYECDLALAGGVTIRVPQTAGYLYQEGGLASPDGHCRAFDARAQGTVFGSGAGVVALKRLADARAAGDYIHAIIKGSAINNDGALKVSYTAPGVEGQAEVIAAAQAVARVNPGTIGYVEAHGTGTALGDPIEIAALTKAFRLGTERTGFCALGSVKTNVGHLDAAAGVAGLIKAVLALKHKQIPPSLHFETPNPQIDFAAGPFYVNTALRDWSADGHPRRAGVSSFGVGGTNAHVILEEASPPQSTPARQPWHLLALSAKSEPALETATANLASYLKQHPDCEIADVAYTLQNARGHFRYRRALVCADRTDALAALEERDPGRLLSHDAGQARPVVFMFPGQGAQYPGMGRGLYESEPVFRAALDRCARLLRWHLDVDLREALYPQEPRTKNQEPRTGRTHEEVLGSGFSVLELDQTWLAQPALFAVEYALAQLWIARGVRPAALIGHSVGELVAACLAGVFSLEDALALVAARGRMMQALPGGAMLAVALGEAEVAPYLGGQIALAAVNEPARCALSGPEPAIAALEAELAAREVATRRLHTSHAFHSAMMDPLLDDFAALVGRIRLSSPRIPFISNLSGTWITAEEATDPHYWARHLRHTVRFAAGIATLLRDGERVLLETGPGHTLSAAARQAGQAITIASLRHPREQTPDGESLLAATARLWLCGASIDWPGLYPGERRQRIPLPTYPFDRQRYWIAPQQQAGVVEKRPDSADWLYLPSWKRSLAPRPVDSLAGDTERWLIFADECGLAGMLHERLRAAGQDSIRVVAGAPFRKLDPHTYAVDPHDPETYADLLAELRAADRLPQRIVHCWAVTPPVAPATDGAAFEARQYQGLYSLIFLAQALERHDCAGPLQIAVVSNNMQQVAGEALFYPEKATLLAPCKSIPQEYPAIGCRSIDIVLPESAATLAELAGRLLAECAARSTDTTIAYRDRQRWVQTFEPVRIEPAPGSVTRAGGVYLVTGALWQVGLELAEALLQTGPATLALLDDRALPPRADWAGWLAHQPEQDATSRIIRRLQALEARGAALLLLQADLADAQQLHQAAAQVVERYGRIDGVIHAGGTAEDALFKSLQETEVADCQARYVAAAHSLFALQQALDGLPLDFCLVCSSLAAVLGGRGSTTYAAASLFMDAFVARHNATSSVPWISVNWDAWHDQAGGLRSSLAQYALGPGEAGEVLRRILAGATADQIVVSTGDLPARIRQWLVNEPRDQERAPATRQPRPALAVAYAAPRAGLEQTIAETWEQVLGFAPIGLDDNFFDLGGDSLAAIQVIARLKKRLEMAIPASRLYQGVTMRALAELLAQDAGEIAQRRQAQLQQRKEQIDQRRQYQQARRSARKA